MRQIDDILEQLSRGEIDLDSATRELLALQSEHGVTLGLEPPSSPKERPAAPQPSVEVGVPQPAGAALAPDELAPALATIVREWIARSLAVKNDDVADDVKFFDLGFDSAKVIGLSSELGQELGVELYPTLLFEHENVADLARYLAESHPDEVGRLVARRNGGAPVVTVAVPVAATLPVESTTPHVVEPSADHILQRAAPTAGASEHDDPIAVVGYACRFPGAPDKQRFWELLVEGRSGIDEIPRERFDWRDHYGPAATSAAPFASNRGGFIEGVYEFDAPFFGISRREAELMDPQQRVFLETVWHAIEDAGCRPAELARAVTGLFVGVSTFDYVEEMKEAGITGEAHFGTGIAHSVLANRVSFLLDLKGPSEAVDTACSSSLVALHRAMSALRQGECEIAIVGGVNALLTPRLFASFSRAGMLSGDGVCRSFGAGASGYVRGEGVGVVVLKSLSRARRDGDRICAVLRGTAVAHGGRTNSLTAPSVTAETSVIERAQRAAAIDPATVSYVEAHGTGTPLGDPIEIEALKKALSRSGTAGVACAVGSVKSNIGHLEAAAGIAGVIKVLLALEHRTLPASLHAEALNPLCNVEGSPLRVVTRTEPWQNSAAAERAGVPRRAGVSSFGFGGTNAHVVLEEFVAEERHADAAVPQLLLFSAKTAEALAAQVATFRRWLDDRLAPGAVRPRLADVAYTLALGREPLAERLAVVTSSLDELANRLAQATPDAASDATRGIYRGRVDRANAGESLVDESAAGRAYLDALIEERKLEKLARLFLSGTEIEWARVVSGRKIPVPGYTFARETYRVSASRGAGIATAPARIVEVARPVAPPPVEAPRGVSERVVRDRIRALVAQTLAVDPDAVDVDLPYSELGVDSVLAVELVGKLNDSFGSALRTAELFSYSTVRKLAEHVHVVCGATLDAEPAPAAPSGTTADAPSFVPALETRPSDETFAVAVVGMAGMFPGADDVVSFWRNLERGVCSVSEVPAERWSIADYYDPDPQAAGKAHGKWGAFMAHAADFDPGFFGIAPKEALLMDPQQRLFLQEAYRALEDAGFSERVLSERDVGVFVGATTGDYRLRVCEAGMPTDAHSFMGGSGSILAARIAYALNLRGLALSVDTACSSGLMALHLACESLRSGSCELALAGGVCVLSTPEFHVFASKSGILSPTGACRTFDQSADGIVPGEAVGVLVLRPLARALAEGDRIYGVIRASATNQDGRTNGITAPSGASQTALELETYERFGVDPATIGYVEAHGTGTRLGDPIEVEALKGAFARHTTRRGFCALGSVKTNVGHTLTAAGAVSVIKVLLSLQHKKLAPSLHHRTTNDEIALDGSPFYVCSELREFSPVGGAALRRAAVSAFGYSGTNCHLVLEEAPEHGTPRGVANAGSELVVLSAKDATLLRERARSLAEWLAKYHPELADVAFTANQRRTHFPHRLAVVARTVEELRAQLLRFAETGSSSGAVSGLARESETDGALDEAPALERAFAEERSPEERDALLARLATLFVNGADGAALARPARVVSLPGHPFRTRRFWLGSSHGLRPMLGTDQGLRLHALLDRALPVTGAARFEKHFDAHDPLIHDHSVRGTVVVPGVAQIEMVRAAFATTLGLTARDELSIRNLTWSAPCIPGENGCRVALTLTAADGCHEFRVTPAVPAPNGGKEVVYSRGSVEVIRGREPGALLDVDALRARTEPVDRDALYARLAARGLEYGARYRTITAVRRNDDESFGEVELGPEHSLEAAGLSLHPALLDGALQSIASLVGDDAWPEDKLLLPYSVGEVLICSALPSRVAVYARRAEADPARGVYRFNVAVLDREGRLLVRLTNFVLLAANHALPARPSTSRAAQQPEQRAPAPTPAAVRPGASESSELFLRSTWRAATRSDESGAARRTLIFAPRGDALADELVATSASPGTLRIELGEIFDRTAEATQIDVRRAADFERVLAPLEGGERIYYFASELEGALLDVSAQDRAEEHGVLPLFRLLKAWQKRGKDGELVLVTRGVHDVVPSDAAHLNPASAALLGLVKVAAHELPSLRVALVDLEAKLDSREVLGRGARALAGERCAGRAVEVALRAGTRFERSTERGLPSAGTPLRLRDGGAYVIAGGAAGLGLEVAVWLAERHAAKVVLLGRSQPSDRTTRAEERVRRAGGAALYLECDITNPEQTRAALQTVRESFGRLDGVIHSALVLCDRSFARMTEAEFLQALRVKTRGSVVLASALEGVPLDFFVFFSSINSVVGNAGQANYVAGCTFMDAFARTLQKRHGWPTQIVNWGYWGETGSVALPEYREALARRGLLPLSNVEGLRAFEELLARGCDQAYVVKADARAHALLGLTSPEPRAEEPASAQSLGVMLRAHSSKRGPDLRALVAQFEELDRLAVLRLIAVLSPLGVLPKAGVSTSAREMALKLTLPAKYERLLEALVTMLEARGYVRRAGERIESTERLCSSTLGEQLRELPASFERFVASCPDLAAHVRLVEQCLKAYPAVLTGKVPATEVLFPDSSMSLVSDIYAGNRLSDYFNALVAESIALCALRAHEHTAKPFRVLELGAGTGGTSGVVLERLAAACGGPIEFVYTDISPGFTRYGARKFGAKHPNVTFRVLDIERDPEEQGYAAGSFDLVFGTNVLHATRDIRRALRHARKLLGPGGRLVVNELTGVRDITTLTFGLLDGWWLYEDAELRLPNAALLSREQWARALGDSGFAAPAFFAGPAVEADPECFQTLIIAELGPSSPVDAPVRKRDSADRPAARSAAPVAASPRAEAVMSSSDEKRLDAVVDSICDVLAVVSGIARSEIDRDLPFSDFGVDSIMAVDIVDRLSQALKVELRASDLFSYSSVNALAAHAAELGVSVAEPGAAARSDASSLFDDEKAPNHGASAAPPPTRASEASPKLHSDDGLVPALANEPASPRNEPGPAQNTVDIAIIGVSGMFPGARDVTAFWENLKAGRCSVGEVPKERWDADAIYDTDPQAPGKSISRWGGFMEGATEFDPLFFNLSPKEAELMDPQQRLFLQEAYKALEDGGYSEGALAGRRVGVFVGAAPGDYLLRLRDAGCPQDSHLFTGNASSILSGRIAYHLNLKGPALTLDTACSSSLLAIHTACESLRSGACEAALAGGVSTLSTAQFHVLATKSGMLSPTGVCHAFDQQADGMVPAEAVAVFLLKPLARALADRDRIYGVIRGSAANQDGKTNGITAPSAASQAELERTVYERFGIDPATIGYVETHGTGTKLGDPIEVDALKDAFRPYTQNAGYCALASVKSNIGHPLAAAGAASMSKVVMSLAGGLLAPSLHHHTTNEHIELDGSPFFVNTELRPWLPVGGSRVRRAAVSSFGFSGTNVHVIVDEAPPPAPNTAPAQDELLCISAKSKDALVRRMSELEAFLAAAPEGLSLTDVAFTLNERRTHFAHRVAIVAGSVAELSDKLRRYAEGSENAPVMQSSGREPSREARRAMRSTVAQLTQGVAGCAASERAERLTALGWLYAEGHDVGFSSLYPEGCGRLLSVPSYPFLRDRYFVAAASKHEARAERAELTRVESRRPAERAERALLAPRWEPLVPGAAPGGVPAGTFLVLVPANTAAQLRRVALSGSLACVFVGPSASGTDVDRHADLNDAPAGRLLACDVLAAYPDLAGVLDFRDLEAADVAQSSELGRTALVQELLLQRPSRQWRFVHFTSGLERRDHGASHAGAWMASLLSVLDAEYGRVSARSLDLEETPAPEQLWGAALAELVATEGPVRVVERGGSRLARCLRRVSGADLGARLALKPDAVYLVSGATGDIGFALCKRLLERGARKLGLLGLRIPEREAWVTPSVTADARLAKKIARLRELEAMGAEIHLHHGALTDVDGLSSFFADVEHGAGPLAGLAHCAAYVDYSAPSFRSKSVEGLTKVLEPKYAALSALEAALGERELDFFVVFSSVTAALPELAVGVCDYASANACADAWIRARFHGGKSHYRSIEFTDFNDTEMGRHATRRTRERGFLGHDTATGLDLFEAALSVSEPVLLPCVCNPELVERGEVASPQPMVAAPAAAPAPKVDSVPLRERAERGLAALFSRQLKIPTERLELDTPFGDWGVDSIVVAELVHKLEPELGAPFEPAAILEHPTLRRLAKFLSDEYPSAVARWGASEHDQPEPEAHEPADAPAAAVPPPAGMPPAAVTPAASLSAAVAPVEAAPQAPKPMTASGARVPVAIIGIACDFPGAKGHAAFFESLSEGISSVREVPASRWSIARSYSADPKAGHSYGKWGGFLEDIAGFDPEYFGINAADAADIDPLERKFLLVAAEALCDAGYRAEELAGRRIGVFVGARSSNFCDKISGLRKNTIIGIGQNFIAAHASHIFDFRGPNMVVDTACSSSLVSVHLACQSIALGESEAALAGGVEVLLDERPYLLLSEAKALSPDGTCHVFDSSANGFVPGEGCGVVLLKRLDRALADGDRIYAVIEASAVNNDGRTMGVTTPNIDAQKDVVETALKSAAIDPRSIGYVEAHGTGTMIGDPIELKALSAVFRTGTEERQYCAIGSVKSNFGHLLSAAGIAGLIKAALCVHHGRLVPTLHCETPNPRFRFADSPFYLSLEATDFEPWQGRRRAAVSAFGFGGTNCHIIVGSAPPDERENVRAALPPPAFKLRRFWPEPRAIADAAREDASNGERAAHPPVAAAPRAPTPEAAAGRRPMLRLSEQSSSNNLNGKSSPVTH